MNQQNEIFVWGGIPGLVRSFSPFCMKAIYAAKLKGIHPKITTVAMKMPTWAKRGTLPIAIINGKNVEDSSQILLELDQDFSIKPLLYPIDPKLRLETKFFEDWADEYFSSFGVVYRWKDDEHFEAFVKKAFGKVPALIRALILPKIRKETIEAHAYRTIGGSSRKERLELYRQAIDLIAYRLGEKPYLIFEELTAADLAVYTCIEQVYRVSAIPELIAIIDQHSNLKAWMKRLEQQLTIE